jgi:hypothetical protein
MHDVDIMEKTSKNAYKLKEFKFKPGNIIKFQGHQAYVVDYLVKNENLDENNIITGFKNVHTICYYDNNNKKHRHYVDIYIPSLNKCIEVKSNWTEKRKRIIFFFKQKAAKDLGYNYEMWIYYKKN